MSKGAARRLGYILAARRNGNNEPPKAYGVVAIDTDAGQGYLFDTGKEAEAFAEAFGSSVGGRDSETLVQCYPVMDLREPAQPKSSSDALGRALSVRRALELARETGVNLRDITLERAADEGIAALDSLWNEKEENHG